LVRFGGDEFVFLLTGLHKGEEAAFIADKILHLLKTPFELSVITTCVSCSIGIALYPDDGTTDTELLKVADTLMYQVKAQGKNNYTFNKDQN
jgi:diguanylate cyclase (GGDEF)-like protein